MAQQLLHHDDINAIFQQMRSITVAQHVYVHFFNNACITCYALYGPLHAALAITAIKAFAFRVALAFKDVLYGVLGVYISFNSTHEVLA